MVAGLPPHKVNTTFSLSFMEYLQHSIQHSKASIANYMAATKAFHIIHGLETTSFRDEHLSLFLKSLTITSPLAPIIHTTIGGDVIFPHKLQYLLLSGQRQFRTGKTTFTLPLPHLGASSLCRVNALEEMYHSYPASNNEPLSIITRSTRLVPLTDSVARKHLKSISVTLDLPKSLTPSEEQVLLGPFSKVCHWSILEPMALGSQMQSGLTFPIHLPSFPLFPGPSRTPYAPSLYFGFGCYI